MKVYRWGKPNRVLCTECEKNIARGMPVIYVPGPNRPIHSTCLSLFQAR